MIRRLSNRENIILAVCLLLGFAYTGHHFVFKSLKGSLTSVEDKVKSGEKRLKSYLKILKKEKAVDEEYNIYSALFRQSAPDDQQMTSVLSEIEAVANEVNMRLADIKPRRVKRAEFYNNFSVSLTIEGEPADIIRFLYALQNNPHFFKADEVYFERSSVRTTQLRCRLILSKALIF